MPATFQIYATEVEAGIVVSSTLIIGELYSPAEVPFTPDPTKLQIEDGDGDGLISRQEFAAATGGGGLGLNGGNDVTLFAGTVANENTGTLYSATQYNVGDDLNTLINALSSNFLPVDLTDVAICLAKGTLIKTAHGEIPIEDLCVGDRVKSIDGRDVEIRWIGSKTFTSAEMAANPKLRPVRILAGALGAGLPRRDLLVSRQHRMLVSSNIALRMFGEKTVLVAAIKLTELPGIYVDTDVESVEYFHLLFDDHEVISAEGAPTESLFTGPEAVKAVAPEAKRELLAMFPQLCDREYAPAPARFIPRGSEQKRLVARHLKNATDVIGW